ncbi:MAG: citrate synthase [Gemmatimonadetes bacterium]|nr:citrate synthase [Gemmatimonadota bacterium]
MSNNSSDTLTITDNRTQREYEISILDGNVIRAMDLRQIKVRDEDFGMMAYDPGFTNTAFTISRITDVKGGEGILEYRGYPIEQLAEQATFLEVASLILNGELPTREELDQFVQDVTFHTYVHENVTTILQGFRYDAHAMGMMISTVAALSTFYPEAREIDDPENRRIQITRLIAKMPTLAAFAYRHHKGLPYVYPENGLSYTANFLNMLFRIGGREYKPNPVLERALDVLFILHADHEQNCSTTAMRVIGSSRVDPFSALAGAMAALFGPLHGGANEAVLRMLTEIGTRDNIPAFMDSVRRGERRLMGFGHRVYKAYDPRASIIKRTAEEVFEVTGRNPLLDIALELEQIALQEEYFVKRNLYPNVDFYSGLIYQAMGFPVELFPVLFAIPRTVGWLTQWEEMVVDREQKIARPRQVFMGHPRREYVPIDSR